MQDPREQGPKPPQEENKQPVPGLEADMQIKPDFGEESYRGHNRLQGKAALITGADSGIGRAVALAFAREGADVMVSYLNEHEDAQETERVIREAGRKAVLVPGDIGDEAHCRQMVEQAVAEFGHLDILVNNAAFQMSRQSIEEISSEEFDRTIKTNLYAMFYLCKAALPHLQPGAVVINTSSIQAFNPSPDLIAYASTKAAIANFTKGLSKMAMKQGVRVNAVAPGPVWTPLIPATMPEEKVQQFGQQTSFERAAQPAELAPIYVFLASSEASYVTGETYSATGGSSPL
ncbi:MAG TPA: SDR family oxidoreductase [Abditibacteriaceae bacterium]